MNDQQNALCLAVAGGVHFPVAGVTPGIGGRRTLSDGHPLGNVAFGVFAVGNSAKSKLGSDSKANEAASQTDSDLIERTKNVVALNNLAWELATSPNDRIRDGTLAVMVAQHACVQTHFRVPVMIGTLAAAYAETGRFDDAVSMGQKACSVASTMGDTNLLQRNQELVALYQKHQPYHEPPYNSAAIPK